MNPLLRNALIISILIFGTVVIACFTVGCDYQAIAQSQAASRISPAHTMQLMGRNGLPSTLTYQIVEINSQSFIATQDYYECWRLTGPINVTR